MRAFRFLLALLALPAAAPCSDGFGNLELSRIPASVRRQGSGAALGGYDSFTPFSNPALLANQPRSWEAAFSGQRLMGGDTSLFGLAGSWAGANPDKGAFGGALMLVGGGPKNFPYLDLQGEQGADISYVVMRAGGVASWQRGIFSLGAGAEYVSEGFNEANGFDAGDRQSLGGIIVHGGALARVSALDLAVAYHRTVANNAGGASLDAGAAWRFRGWYRGSAFFETSIAMAGDSSVAQIRGNSSAFGLTWNPHRILDVRAGMQLPSAGDAGFSDPSAHAGFTVRWGSWSLDYAFSAAGNGLGMNHSLGIGRGFGAERPEPTPLDFSRLFARKDSGPAFQLSAKDRSLAVANFEAQNVSAGDAAVISDLLRSALVQEGAFNIVEKANMDKILQEQAFQQTGCTSQECAVKIGKVLNVKYLIVGSFGKTLDQYLMAMRVVEVETARIVYSDEAMGKNLDELRGSIKVMAKRLSAAVK